MGWIEDLWGILTGKSKKNSPKPKTPQVDTWRCPACTHINTGPPLHQLPEREKCS